MDEKHQANKEVPIMFADDKMRMVRPLTISRLRRFIKAVNGLDKLKEETLTDDAFDKMMDAARIVLEKVDNELVSNPEALEEAIDLETFGKIMAVAMGNRTVDPNE